MRKEGDYLQVICSGCTQPKENHGGWVSLFDLETPQSSNETLLRVREKWARSEQLPSKGKETWSKEDLCRLFDHGYEQTEEGIIFRQQENMLLMQKESNEWITKKLQLQAPDQLSGRGCGVQRTGGKPLPAQQVNSSCCAEVHSLSQSRNFSS